MFSQSSKELRGEKIDIIEWSDEPSVFAANALSPAKVSQVRITDINDRKMEVIVSEDQFSLAIGKRGQNVRLATRLVGWDIDIVSEEVLKKEITRQMGEMMASGEAVPMTALEGVSAVNAETLAEKGIEDIETLANTSVDEIVEILDVSMDEAEKVLISAKQVVELRNEPDAEVEGEEDSTAEGETEAVETAADETLPATEEAPEAETSESDDSVAEESVVEEAVVEEAVVEEAVVEEAPEAAVETEAVAEVVEAESVEETPEAEAVEEASEVEASEAKAVEEASETEKTAAPEEPADADDEASV